MKIRLFDILKNCVPKFIIVPFFLIACSSKHESQAYYSLSLSVEKNNLIKSALFETMPEHDYKLAKFFLEKSLKLSQNNFYLYRLAGKLEHRIGNFAKARELYEKARKIDGKQEDVELLLGMACLHFDDPKHHSPKDAISLGSRVLALARKHGNVDFLLGISALLLLSKAYFELGEGNRGLAYGTRAMEKASGHPVLARLTEKRTERYVKRMRSK